MQFNMTEFAFSGLGTNAHYGDARSPFERDPHDPLIGRVVGGHHQEVASISDEYGTTRLGQPPADQPAPAAFCSIVGLKPTTTRMPGVPGQSVLSTSFDAAGPMANSVSRCAILDDIMAGGPGDDASAMPVAYPRLAMPKGYLFDDLDPHTMPHVSLAIDWLSAAGASITDITIAAIEQVVPSNRSKSTLPLRPTRFINLVLKRVRVKITIH